MGPQAAGKGAKNENDWKVETLHQVFIEFYVVPSGHIFFHLDSEWDPKVQLNGRALNIFDK
jgi:hypothetical protein